MSFEARAFSPFQRGTVCVLSVAGALGAILSSRCFRATSPEKQFSPYSIRGLGASVAPPVCGGGLRCRGGDWLVQGHREEAVTWELRPTSFSPAPALSPARSSYCHRRYLSNISWPVRFVARLAYLGPHRFIYLPELRAGLLRWNAGGSIVIC